MMKRLICCVCLVSLLVGCLCGCSILYPEPTLKVGPGDAMVIIVGRHANARMYTEEFLDEYVMSLVDKCVTVTENGSSYIANVNISVIVSDGNPTACEVTYKGQPMTHRFERQQLIDLEEEVEDYKNVLKEFLLSDDLRADDPEVDMSAAITEAATILNNRKAENKHIFIWDTGVVTDGFLDMRKLDIQQGTVDDVIELVSPGAFPKLDGINVYFYGLGNVAGGQIHMGEDNLFTERFVNFWKAYFAQCAENSPLKNELTYFERSGKKMVYNDEGESLYPRVSSVSFVLSENAVPPNTEGGETSSEKDVITLNSQELNFEGGQWTFVDGEDAAIKALETYKHHLAKMVQSGEIIYVVGSIAKTKYDSKDKASSDVSMNRALVVQKLLEDHFGFQKNQIKVVDAGNLTLPWRNAVEFPNGEKTDPDEAAAAMVENRLVAIFPESNTERVQVLKGKNLI